MDDESLQVEGDYSQEDEEDFSVAGFDIVAIPNDYNVKTINDLIDSNTIRIPNFQRNYVWDIRKASKLIESIILGIPVPQLFLYEERDRKGEYLVIDGQQRLMTIFYFMKKRFPRIEKRAELRKIFDEKGTIPPEVLHNDDYFMDFNLQFMQRNPDSKNPYNGLNYHTLTEAVRTIFERRPIRNVVVRQLSPPEHIQSSKLEIFSRLNTGGVNLTPQELRASIFHSKFYSMLSMLNMDSRWRKIVGKDDADLHMKDIELLLRCFAILTKEYTQSMSRFLNVFSEECKNVSEVDIKFLSGLFNEFLNVYGSMPSVAFSEKAKRFNISVFEAVFYAVAIDGYRARKIEIRETTEDKLQNLRIDTEFIKAVSKDTTSKANVATRLRRAQEVLLT